MCKKREKNTLNEKGKNMNFSDILLNFEVESKAEPFGNGHINDTFLANSVILQRINTAVFKNPDELMSNIVGVTDFLREKAASFGEDPTRITLKFLKSVQGKYYYRDEDGNCFRAYNFIDNSQSFETVSPDLLYKAAKAFGKFQVMLADYPADTLFETIPFFHDTSKRFEAFRQAVSDNLSGRVENAKAEIEFALAREKDTSVVVDAIADGSVPLRVTHNDTKLNNVLFDKATNEDVCVIDLDTVMPGSLLYDYGDALRFGASSEAEDEKDLDKIYFELDKYEAFTKGFLEVLKNTMTAKEIELLPFSVKLMTYECGIRFLGDYINGDTYFKTAYPEHNLDRARTQFKLVADIEKKFDQMKAIVQKYI